jgi:hypothetical protein
VQYLETSVAAAAISLSAADWPDIDASLPWAFPPGRIKQTEPLVDLPRRNGLLASRRAQTPEDLLQLAPACRP